MIAAGRATEDGRWLRCYAPRPQAAARIVCFGPAGAAASFFRDWGELASDDVEVWSLAYPGRERRCAEAPIERMDELADRVAAELTPRLTRPTLLFGHSMGASVAFEVARRLERDGPGPGPSALVVSGRPGPRRQREEPRDLHTYDDGAIAAYVRELGGTPAELLDDPEMLELILPPFRSDFALIGRYRPAAGAVARTPAIVIWGDRDPDVGPRDAREWAQALPGLRDARAFAGGHFFLSDRSAEVVAYVISLFAIEAVGPG